LAGYFHENQLINEPVTYHLRLQCYGRTIMATKLLDRSRLAEWHCYIYMWFY